MRRALAQGAVLAAAVAAFVACARQARGRPNVSVAITCPQSGFVVVNYRGWVVHRDPGQDVVIQVAAGANVSSITIEPKNAGSWPFAPAPPYVVSPGGQQVITVDDTARAGTYSYILRGTCTRPNEPAQSVTIDPDIVVD